MASTPTRDLQEEFLAATRKSQETVVRAIKIWVETVRAVTPKLPTGYAPLADRLPKLPSVTVPFTDKLPKPEEVVANGYDFAEHLLALQRKFAEGLLEATVPLMPLNGKSPNASAARSELRAAAPVVAAFKPAPAPQAAPKPVVAVSEPKVVAVSPMAVGPRLLSEPKVVAVPTAKVEAKAPATATPEAPAAQSAPKPSAARPAPKTAPAARARGPRPSPRRRPPPSPPPSPRRGPPPSPPPSPRPSLPPSPRPRAPPSPRRSPPMPAEAPA